MILFTSAVKSCQLPYLDTYNIQIYNSASCLKHAEVGKMSVSDRSRRSLAHVADAVVNVLERITSQKHSMPSGVFLFIAGDGIPSLPRNPTKFFTPIERGDVDIEA